MLDQLLKSLRGKEFRDILAHVEEIPETQAEYARPAPPLPKELARILLKSGIEQLYSHQCASLDIVRSGGNPVLITPTASGKTLAFNIPIIEQFLKREGGHALYIFPLKALEQDQLKQLEQITSKLPHPDDFQSAVYDGDTPEAERRKIRAKLPRFILTNPEMLHLTVSGFHRSWTEFLRGLRFIVVDELHTYKGIFGSHMAQLFRRLDRICRYYGSNPQYIACSATIANPLELAENLTGKKFTLVEKSGAPMPKRTYVFLNPETSVYSVAGKLLREGIKQGMKTIVFTKARRITELIYQWTIDQDPKLNGKIAAYRAGFLPEERREIEHKLNAGELYGVVSTSALEMGVDIGSLDLGILVGYPGTVSATFQRGGRVGRRQESAVILIAQQNALDQYFMNNPGDFFGRSFESAIVNQTNPYILKEHIVCAAAELPILKTDPHYPPKQYPELFNQLENEGLLQLSGDGERWFSLKQRPQRDVDIRAAGSVYTITNKEGRLIGSVSGANVYGECHKDAIYLHMGKQYQVTELDLQGKNVVVKPAEVDYYTSARSQKDTAIISDKKSRKLSNFVLHIGELRVTEWITGYEKRRTFSQELLGTFPLELPEMSYQTIGLWMEIPRDAAAFCEKEEVHFMGGLHGLEHAMLSLIPLFAICDRGDMGGISMVEHPGAKGPAIFLYDGYPGGVGLAERVFDIFEGLLERTHSLVKNCKCENGCPSCIHSPRCGSGNYPLDKKAVLALLSRFTGEGNFIVQEPPKKQLFQKPPIKPKTKPLPEPKPAEVPSAEGKTGPALVFDTETQMSAEEVGGWGNIAKMRLAVGVTMELESGKIRTYYEEDAEALVEALMNSKLVIGFNSVRFDYTVLEPYGLTNPGKIESFDILQYIEKTLKFRIKLNSLCEATLNEEKSADGLQSIDWFKQGKMDWVTAYCIKDVKLTRDIYLFGKEKGYLLYDDKNKGRVRVKVKW